jgi:hypothetical protein
MITTLMTLAVWTMATAATIWSAMVIWRALKEEKLMRDRHS